MIIPDPKKRQKNWQKVLIVCILMLILVAGALIVNFKIKQDKNQDLVSVDTVEVTENDDQPETLKEATTPEEYQKCDKAIEESIVGVWGNLSTEEGSILSRYEFRRNNTFIYHPIWWDQDSKKAIEGEDIYGEWSYGKEKGTITLRFNRLDRFLKSLFKMSEDGFWTDSIVSYSLEDKEATFFIKYASDPSIGFEGTCEKYRFMIEVFGTFYYNMTLIEEFEESK